MTPQEIFDKVLAHLRKQGVRAIAHAHGCAYRGANGTMCAVGCLIPDDLYDPLIEGVGVFYEQIKAPAGVGAHLLREILTQLGLIEHVELLRNLQAAHDNGLRDGRDEFERRMAAIAYGHGLVYAPPA